MAPGQAASALSRLKIFGEGSRVRAMHENVGSIVKQCRF